MTASSVGLRRRGILAAAIMLGGAALAVAARPTRHLADELGMPDLEALFPKAFAGWGVDAGIPVILPSPEVQALLDKIYNQTLARTYVGIAGQRMMLSVAYGGDQSDGTSAHRPEVCYPAQGFAIRSNRASSVLVGGRALRVRLLDSHLGPRNEPITYWVVVGDTVVLSGLEQKLAQMRYGLRGLIADGLLVRVSSIDADERRAHAAQAAFLNDLWAGVSLAARQRIFGTSS